MVVHDSASGIQFIDMQTKKEVRNFPLQQVIATSLSPCNTFLLTFQRFAAFPENNLVLWRVSDGKKMAAFTQKQVDREN